MYLLRDSQVTNRHKTKPFAERLLDVTGFIDDCFQTASDPNHSILRNWILEKSRLR